MERWLPPFLTPQLQFGFQVSFSDRPDRSITSTPLHGCPSLDLIGVCGLRALFLALVGWKPETASSKKE